MQRAQAYDQLGREEDARKAALAGVAMTEPGAIDNYLKLAYELLYRIAQRRGALADELSYYKQYVTQDKAAVDDAGAQALAYQTVQQQVLTRNLEAAALARQNRILKLQQALDAKAAETGRLYITLLVMLLLAILLWLILAIRSQRRFRHMASRDGLTGILNHQHFIRDAEHLLHQLERKQSPASLIAIDLDHFKQINDTHGHAMGDAVLQRTVDICRQQLRPDDLFGRLGGEEFAILLPDCSPAEALSIADRLRRAISAPPTVPSASILTVFASMGVAGTSTSGYTMQQLRADADDALYRAKREGRNRVVVNKGRDTDNQPEAVDA